MDDRVARGGDGVAAAEVFDDRPLLIRGQLDGLKYVHQQGGQFAAVGDLPDVALVVAFHVKHSMGCAGIGRSLRRFSLRPRLRCFFG